MKEQELFDMLNTWENNDLLCAEIVNNPKYFAFLMNIAFNYREKRSWRAAYMIDKIFDLKPQLVKPCLPQITERLKTEINESKLRHWLRLISLNEIEEEQMGFLFDYCLNIFTIGDKAVALRVHAMQILYNISEKEKELKPEVLQVIEQELEKQPTAGIRSRGKKLAKKLQQEIRKMIPNTY